MVHGELSILIGIISVIALLLSIRAILVLTGGAKIPIISTFFFLNYVVYAFVGSVILNMFYLEYDMNTHGYLRKDFILNIWLYSISGLFLIIVGMFIANITFYDYKPKYNAVKLLTSRIEITKKDTSNTMFFIVLSLFLVGLATFINYAQKIHIPLLSVFDDISVNELAHLRSESGAAVDKFHRYVMLMRSLPMLLVIIAFFLRKKGLKWRVLFYVLFIYDAIVCLSGLEKALLLKLIILLSLAKFYFDNKVNKKIIYRIGFIITILMIIMYMLFMGLANQDFITVFLAPFNRIFVGQIRPFYYYQVFQEHFGYIYGTSFPNPRGIFPFEWRMITVEIMMFAHPELARLGIIGSFPTVFWGEWYINFGPVAALFSMIFFGFLVQMLDILFITRLNKRKSLLMSALFIHFIMHFSKYSQTSFIGIVLDMELILPVIAVGLIIFLRQLLLKGMYIMKKNE